MSELAEGRSRAAQQGLGASLREAHRLYIRRLQEHLSGRGMTVAQYLHTRVLFEDGTLTQTEISARLGIEKASSTGALEALERAGLVVRQRDPGDRRRVNVALSEAGVRAAQEILPYAREIALDATKDVAEEDLETFFRVLDVVMHRLSGPRE